MEIRDFRWWSRNHLSYGLRHKQTVFFLLLWMINKRWTKVHFYRRLFKQQSLNARHGSPWSSLPVIEEHLTRIRCLTRTAVNPFSRPISKFRKQPKASTILSIGIIYSYTRLRKSSIGFLGFEETPQSLQNFSVKQTRISSIASNKKSWVLHSFNFVLNCRVRKP